MSATQARTVTGSTVNEYDAKVDARKRITLRGAEHEHYHVVEYEDGTVLLEPRVLVHPDKISKRSLQTVESSMKNFKDGKVSEEVDPDELLDAAEQ